MTTLSYASSGSWVQLAGGGGGSGGDSSGLHKYNPNIVVPLSSPTTITVTESNKGNLGTYGSTTDLKIIVDGSATQSSGTANVLSFTGGRNAWIVGKNGGKLIDTRTTTSQKNVILRQNAYGDTFIDSLHMDSTAAMSVDVIVIRGYAPADVSRAGWTYPKTYIQNCRIEGSQYTGTFSDPHPDNFQKQTALGSVYFYKVTSTFIYQAYLIAAQSFSLSGSSGQEQWVEGLKDGSSSVDGEMRFEQTDTYRTTNNYYGPAYWIGWNTAAGNNGFPGEDNFPIYFDGEDNWVKGGTNGSDTMSGGGGLVYPTGSAYSPGSTPYGGSTGTIAHTYNSTDGISPYATWVPAANIAGKLREGRRPSGDHVTAASLVGYTSPYAT